MPTRVYARVAREVGLGYDGESRARRFAAERLDGDLERCTSQELERQPTAIRLTTTADEILSSLAHYLLRISGVEH